MTKIFSLLLMFFSLTSYSQDTIYYRRLTKSTNCIWTKKGETKPFTGVTFRKHLSGKKRMVINFEYGIPQGKRIEYYKNGKIRFEGVNVSGDLNGMQIWYYKNGKKKSEEDYVNGKITGLSKGYYNNGSLRSVANFKDSKEEGELTYYFKDGTVMFKEYYSNGKRIKN